MVANPTYRVLFAQKGIEPSRRFPLEKDIISIGKSDDCDIVIRNAYVSRLHALITRRDGAFFIKDIGSKNGTLLNSIPIGENSVKLSIGDRIDLVPDVVVLLFRETDETLTFEPEPGDDLFVDANGREIWIRDRKITPPLSKKEFDIIFLLYQKRGKVCTKDEIAIRGWPERSLDAVSDQDVSQYIRRIRNKLQKNLYDLELIETVYGLGYKMRELA